MINTESSCFFPFVPYSTNFLAYRNLVWIIVRRKVPAGINGNQNQDKCLLTSSTSTSNYCLLHLHYLMPSLHLQSWDSARNHLLGRVYLRQPEYR